MQDREITINLNGQDVSLCTDPPRPLVDVLREELDLTGTKKGCDYEGQCGACTVLVDGRAVRSCRTPLEKVAGKQLVTIEGLAGPDGLHPIQHALVLCSHQQQRGATHVARLDARPGPHGLEAGHHGGDLPLEGRFVFLFRLRGARCAYFSTNSSI